MLTETQHINTASPAWQAFMSSMSEHFSQDQLIRDISNRLALSTDASFYHKVPELVIRADNEQDIVVILRSASQYNIAVTFRAAGTSLSGQAISDSVLIILGQQWQQADVLENGAKIRLQPGVIGAQANAILAPFGKKIGPDPASINACKIGGIAANNSSGMCCGVTNNSYHTLVAMRLILADGSILDTASAESVKQFSAQHQSLLTQLTALRETLLANAALKERISHQFRLKNTMGYGVNALLDYADPIDILTHLMIGSEGTLGFISAITYRTIDVPVTRASGLYLFANADAACAVIAHLKTCHVDAVELMDSRALHSVANMLATFNTVAITDDAVALLIDIGSTDPTTLHQRLEQVSQALDEQATPVIPICEFTHDPVVIEQLWKIRKGMFPAVGAIRPAGTTVIIEDVAFPLEHLAAGIAGLTTLFSRYRYTEAIIFGHALDGNLHFVFTQSFEQPEDVQRYADFMQEVATLVTKELGGTLKAEHGTGRNMAPFLASQWGQDGLALMQQIKDIFDPESILNPGVIINADPTAHLQHLKTMPSVNSEVDKCIECGFCEPQCPSKALTLTPRQRIALMRRQQSRPVGERQQIDKDFEYLGLETCAATGLCATTCPVGINTGSWIKALRAQQQGNTTVASLLANHLSPALAAGNLAMSAAKYIDKLLPGQQLQQLTQKLHTITGFKTPVWYDAMPGGAAAIPKASQEFEQKVVYMVSCPNRVFGSNENQPSLPETIIRLCHKAQIEVILPSGISSSCCGQPWESTGHPAVAKEKQQHWENIAASASDNGRWPVIIDASPCALQLQTSTAVSVMDITDFLHQVIAPRLQITPIDEPVMLHVTCSSQKHDGGGALRALANLCSTQIIEPTGITCCGFAGQKGFFTPQLNESALSVLANQVPGSCTQGISNSRTCEIGLSRHSGISYSHVAFLLDSVSQATSH